MSIVRPDLAIKVKFSINIGLTVAYKNFELLKFEGTLIFLSTIKPPHSK